MAIFRDRCKASDFLLQVRINVDHFSRQQQQMQLKEKKHQKENEFLGRIYCSSLSSQIKYARAPLRIPSGKSNFYQVFMNQEFP